MALVVVVLSGLAGVVTALVALVGFDASLSQALIIYLVSSIVPVALVMAAVFLHMQIGRAMTTHTDALAAHRFRR